MTRIAFAGTPEFAVPSLEALAAAGIVIDPVLTQPDRRAGRGRALTAPPVKRAAGELGLRVCQPERLDDASELGALGERPDLLIVAAYGLMLPDWLLDWPRVAPVNVHASLLPRWRGAAPIQHAILAGDAETGISLMRMTRGLDTGPVYALRRTAIGAAETGSGLHDRLSRLGAELLIDVLPDILSRRLSPQPQDAAQATYAAKIEKRHAALPWTASAVELARRVRAFNAWPVAEARLTDGRRLRVWEAEALHTASGQGAATAKRNNATSGTIPAAKCNNATSGTVAPGAIVAANAAGIDVMTGRGVLRLTRIQPPGAKAMSAAAYLAAHSLAGAGFDVG